jgi:hypothetical protein
VEGKFYIDHNHPFGLCPASSNSGQISNGLMDIWEQACPSLPSFKFEDDISLLQLPDPAGMVVDGAFRYRYDRQSCVAPVDIIGTPWHEVKTGEHFTFTMTFLGFFWDLIHRRVSLPEPKRLKFLTRVSTFIERINNSDPLTLLDLQIIHGSLVHVCFIYPDGSSRLPTLSNFMSTFHGNTFTTRHASQSVKKTLLWWEKRLSDPLAFRQLQPLGPLQDMGIYVDASTSWGIGIIIGNQWYAFKLVSDWKLPGRDICWLEAVALELLVYFLVQLQLTNTHLLIHSDNNGAIGAHSKGRSRNEAINLCVRRTYTATTQSLIIPSFKYIASALNPSDPISRGELGTTHQRMIRSFVLPVELSTSFIDGDG